MKALVFALTLCACSADTVSAQPAGRDAVREKRIEDQLAAIAPSAVPDFREGTRAFDAGNYPEAARLYGQVLAEAPNFSPALRRAGEAFVTQGQREPGLDLIARALGQERSPANLWTMARAIAYPGRGREGSAQDMRRALALLKEAIAHPESKGDPTYLFMIASIGVSVQSAEELRTAVEALRREYPNEAATHYFGAILHASTGEWSSAEREIHAAEQLGLPPAAVEEFLASGIRTKARVWRAVTATVYALLAWAAGLIVLFIAGRILSAATLRSIEVSDPREVASASELTLRGVYRAVVRSASIYYYVSLPFAAVLVLGVTAAAFYVFMLFGRIPIQLAAVLAIGAIVTLFRMVHSLFARVEVSDPGRSLKLSEAPELWRLTRTVADEVGTRAIDEIRITPGTELAVYEQGTSRERNEDRARRTLILGAGLLHGFPEGAFRAVLAHEYGHFAHRDAAGGDRALRVNQDMMKFAIAMAQHGQAVWWNAAFQFLRVYHFLFRRITHGATRLQEVMADRVAAHRYGAAQFEQGLRHVIRASLQFETAARDEIHQALEMRRPCQNLYTLLPKPSDDLEHLVQDAIERETTEDDTHPSPVDRFRLVSRVASSPEGAHAGMVWDLFANPEALTLEMTHAIEANVRTTTMATV